MTDPLKQAEIFQRLSWKNRPIVLLPGNHDPLLTDSIWRSEAFRQKLPRYFFSFTLQRLPDSERAKVCAICRREIASRLRIIPD